MKPSEPTSAIVDSMVSGGGRGPKGWVVCAVALIAIGAASVGAGVRGMAGALPGEASAEAGFARDMSDHHEQAVEMALLIEGRTENPLVAGLAKDIMLTQQHQRGQMLAWLDLWDLAPTGTDESMAWMGHAIDGRMPGMASAGELATLAGLSGIEADRTFLRLMIRHHAAAVPMARSILERSELRVVRSLAAAIEESQQAEIRTMENLLAESSGPASRAAELGNGFVGGESGRRGHGSLTAISAESVSSPPPGS